MQKCKGKKYAKTNLSKFHYGLTQCCGIFIALTILFVLVSCVPKFKLVTCYFRDRAEPRQSEMSEVYFETVDGGTSGTAFVPTGSPEEEAHALLTPLQSKFGWKIDDIVLELYEPGKYVILFETASMRFIREECSGVEATTEADKKTVQRKLCAYIIRDQIQQLDLNEIYSHYNIPALGEYAFAHCTSLTTISVCIC
jgi:hypothetical protein